VEGYSKRQGGVEEEDLGAHGPKTGRSAIEEGEGYTLVISKWSFQLKFLSACTQIYVIYGGDEF
jgi:hypothetical protein